MKFRTWTAFLLAPAALAALLGGSAIVAAQGEAGSDRSETVGGWQIVDASDGTEDDPTARVIRMTRDLGGQELEYEIRLSAYGGTGWASTSYSAAIAHQNRSCSKSGSAAVETGAPAQRPARLRALLARELGELEGNCGAPSGTTAPLLEGLEAAFARLSGWHGAQLAALEADAADGAIDGMAYAAADDDMNMTTDMNMAMDMDMTVDMNATDMSGDAGYTDMNMDHGDMNGVAPEDEAMADALEAAANALEAATAAAEREPQRR